MSKRPKYELPAQPDHREHVINKLAREPLGSMHDDEEGEGLIVGFLREAIEVTAYDRKVETPTFEDDRIMTGNKGFTLKLIDLGLEFQITVVRSR